MAGILAGSFCVFPAGFGDTQRQFTAQFQRMDANSRSSARHGAANSFRRGREISSREQGTGWE
jgi:hypothetical protein